MTNGRRGSASVSLPVIDRDDSAVGDPLGLAATKKRLRREAKARRAGLSAHQRARAAEVIADNALAGPRLAPGAAVSGYVPIGEEADVMPLLARLAGRGHPTALPAVTERGRPLVFRAWSPGEDLQPGWYGIPCPAGSAPECRPDVVLVPLLAFDRRGHRLGHGAGFYDRTLEELRRHGPALAVGIGFAVQELAHLPAEPHDQPLDWIVTDRETMCFVKPFGFATEAG